MATTTTNNAWPIPQSTDLVKDGATAIAALGSAIDTTLGVYSGSMTLISTTTLTGASVTLSSIPQTYKDLVLIIRNFKPATDGSSIRMTYNGDTAVNRHTYVTLNTNTNVTFDVTSVRVQIGNDNSVATGISRIIIPDYTNATTWKYNQSWSFSNNSTTTTNFDFENTTGYYNQTTVVSSLLFTPNAGNFTSGTILLYGVK
jgi:hypothetical protein